MYDLQAVRYGRALTLHLTGDILMPDITDFMNRLDEQCSIKGISQIVLDLAHVNRMDPAALGVIVSLSTRMQSGGRRIVLLSPAPDIVRLLKEEEIEGFFPTCENEEELRGYIPEASSDHRGAL